MVAQYNLTHESESITFTHYFSESSRKVNAQYETYTLSTTF